MEKAWAMLDANRFVESLSARSHTFFTGVPCSFLTPLIHAVEGLGKGFYVPATSEGEAVAVAAGAWLAGQPAVVLSQNSGLGNMINPLTSLNHPFRIPALLILTWRGEPGIQDEPHHSLMGRITCDQLTLVEVPFGFLPQAPETIDTCLDNAVLRMRNASFPFALIVRDGTFAQTPRPEPCPRGRSATVIRDLSRHRQSLQRVTILEKVLELVPTEAAVIATTGKCGRELYTLADRPQHLYMVGAMGSASGAGLGVALHTTRPVVILDGDGAALMRLGTLATIGAHAPPRLVHIVIDNGVYDSTGGQRTVSGSVDFIGVAAACGYASAVTCDDAKTFGQAFVTVLAEPGPHLLHVRVAPGSINLLGRPQIPPHEVAQRFSAFLSSGM